MSMVGKIFKIGDSLVISLPEDVIEQFGLQEGSEVLYRLKQQKDD